MEPVNKHLRQQILRQALKRTISGGLLSARHYSINVLLLHGKLTAGHQGASPGQLSSCVSIIINQHSRGAVETVPAKEASDLHIFVIYYFLF